MEAIKKIDKVFQFLGNFISAMCMLAMTFIVTIAVIARWVNIPFPAADELARYVMIWFIFIGIIPTTRNKGHATVTVITDRLKGKVKRGYMICLEIVILATIAWLTKLSVDLVIHAVGSHQLSPILRIPYWFLYSSMVIGFGFSFIREIEILIRDYILNKGARATELAEEVSE